MTFVVVQNPKLLLSKWLEEKNLLKMQSANMDIVPNYNKNRDLEHERCKKFKFLNSENTNVYV